MECMLRAVVHSQLGVNSNCIQVHNCTRRNLGIPSWLTLKVSANPILWKTSHIFGHLGELVKEILHLFELYYIASERPPLLTLHCIERKIASIVFGGINYLWRCIRVAFTTLSFSSSSSRTVINFKHLDRDVVFDYCYFGHCLVAAPASNNRGILLCTGLEDRASKVTHNRMRCHGLLHLTFVSPGDIEPLVNSSAMGFTLPEGTSEDFVSCISLDPSNELGIVFLVCFSSGRIEIWKETINVSELTESVWESVAWTRVHAYPLFCKFNPAGEIALVLTTTSLYVVEWDGMDLKCVKIVNGECSDFWSSRGDDVAAVEWLGPLEFVSLTHTSQLLLSRRCESGHWRRVAQFNLQDVLSEWTFDRQCGISRLQYDGKSQLFIKMSGTSQLLHLKWTQREIPDCTILELTGKGIIKSNKYVEVADFCFCTNTGLLALVIRDRTCVLIYSGDNMRFLERVDPPKTNLRVFGISFVGHITSGITYLAVKWVAIPLELMEESFYEFDPQLFREKISASRRCTALYKFATGLYKNTNWSNQTLAEILANKEMEPETRTILEPPSALFSGPRWDKESVTRLPKLTLQEPDIPKKITGFKSSGTSSSLSNRHGFMKRNTTLLADDLKLGKSPTELFPDSERVYSIDEFRRNRREKF
ncbi:Quinoprotein amine dehydrogenase [Babesia duncani]|uniref:Quinoprotein amine dehydrogenase n=1 Tax=Babesia duncani TaxID=323732 RepID=A0AAD9PJA4_9APIC|nr:Quinoprotein amine dehydrogenase [Babesia duncani]